MRSGNAIAIRNVLIAIGSYFLLRFGHYEIPSQYATIFAFIVWFLLNIQTNLSAIGRALTDFRSQAIPELFKAELVIEPSFKKLTEHDAFKKYYSEATPLYEEKCKNKLPEDHPFHKSLWSNYSMRFVFVGGQLWSDFHKTFTDRILFSGKILNFDLSEDNKEPNLKAYVSNGVLRVYLDEDTYSLNEDKSHKICEFPLFIFEEIPSKFLEFHNLLGDERNKYIDIKRGFMPQMSWFGNWDVDRKLSAQSLKTTHAALTAYGFKQFSDGNLDPFTNREGDIQTYEPNDGFRQYRNDYLVVKFKELSE